ncbi:hypothetical protein [Pseudomonas putida]|uniref:hypothetical protein n=1 Tax=Pseudomonas putida TaxID=303 RepID=UPI0012FFB9F2|nr:hypothetical protein [Pseudomonas putida]
MSDQGIEHLRNRVWVMPCSLRRRAIRSPTAMKNSRFSLVMLSPQAKPRLRLYRGSYSALLSLPLSNDEHDYLSATQQANS